MTTWTYECSLELSRLVRSQPTHKLHELLPLIGGAGCPGMLRGNLAFSPWDRTDVLSLLNLPVRLRDFELLCSAAHIWREPRELTFNDLPWQDYLRLSWVRLSSGLTTMSPNASTIIRVATCSPTLVPSFDAAVVYLQTVAFDALDIEGMCTRLAKWLHGRPEMVMLWRLDGHWNEDEYVRRLRTSPSVSFFLHAAAMQLLFSRCPDHWNIDSNVVALCILNLINSSDVLVMVYNATSRVLQDDYDVRPHPNLDFRDKKGIVYMLSNYLFETSDGSQLFWCLSAIFAHHCL